MWLGVALTYQAKRRSNLQGAVAAIVVLNLVINSGRFVYSEQMDKYHAESLYDALADYHEHIIVTTHDFVNRELAQITGRDCYLWSGEMSELTKQVYGHVYELEQDANQIAEWIEREEKIVFVTHDDFEVPKIESGNSQAAFECVGHYVIGAKGVTQDIAIYEIKR